MTLLSASIHGLIQCTEYVTLIPNFGSLRKKVGLILYYIEGRFPQNKDNFCFLKDVPKWNISLKEVLCWRNCRFFLFLKPATSKNQRDIDIHRHIIRDEQCQTYEEVGSSSSICSIFFVILHSSTMYLCILFVFLQE